MAFSFPGNKSGLGLLSVRMGIAVFLIFHSVTRLAGNESMWKGVGKTVDAIDTGLETTTIGLIILILELLGGASIVSGYLFRIGSVLMAVVFGLYTYYYYFVQDLTILPLYSFGFVMVCLGLALTGPGTYIISFTSTGK